MVFAVKMPAETPELFDTHAHFPSDPAAAAAMVARAQAAGVLRMLAVGGDAELNAAAAREPLHALGYDRDQAGREQPPIDWSTVAAVGEIGLDFSVSGAPRAAQLQLFGSQLEIARQFGKSVVVHTRAAEDETAGMLREQPSRGIIHCFTGSLPFCRQLLDLGFFVSISGIVTFKKADNVRAAARYIPFDRLLIETDSPYLAPEPLRGTVNEPANLVHTADFIARLLGRSLAEIAARTTANALAALGLDRRI